MDKSVEIMVMSGVEDGLTFRFASENGDGVTEPEAWLIRMGRRDDNEICLRHDTYSSRYHACLKWKDERWWLEDRDSKNGTFIEGDHDDQRVIGAIPIDAGQLFRVGRTWLRIQQTD